MEGGGKVFKEPPQCAEVESPRFKLGRTMYYTCVTLQLNPMYCKLQLYSAMFSCMRNIYCRSQARPPARGVCVRDQHPDGARGSGARAPRGGGWPRAPHTLHGDGY